MTTTQNTDRARNFQTAINAARQADAQRAEREAQARADEDTRRYQDALSYAAHTRVRADEETRKHAAGQPCNTMFCRYGH